MPYAPCPETRVFTTNPEELLCIAMPYAPCPETRVFTTNPEELLCIAFISNKIGEFKQSADFQPKFWNDIFPIQLILFQQSL